MMITREAEKFDFLCFFFKFSLQDIKIKECLFVITKGYYMKKQYYQLFLFESMFIHSIFWWKCKRILKIFQLTIFKHFWWENTGSKTNIQTGSTHNIASHLSKERISKHTNPNYRNIIFIITNSWPVRNSQFS